MASSPRWRDAKDGRRVVAWNVAYRNRSFLFSHGETYHHTLLSEPTSEWEDVEWTPEREAEIVDYLSSRRRGGPGLDRVPQYPADGGSSPRRPRRSRRST